MDYVTLTARQALQIAEQSDEIDELKGSLRNIRQRLCCIGGPLNDNVLEFNAEQLKLLRVIDSWAQVDSPSDKE